MSGEIAMNEQRRASQDRLRSETSPGHRMLELLGIVPFVVLAFLIAGDAYRGLANFGYLWLLPILALLAYLAADLVSGFVHFLANNLAPPTHRSSGRTLLSPFATTTQIPKRSPGTTSSIPTATTAWSASPSCCWSGPPSRSGRRSQAITMAHSSSFSASPCYRQTSSTSGRTRSHHRPSLSGSRGIG
jgi:hypothetical protein